MTSDARELVFVSVNCINSLIIYESIRSIDELKIFLSKSIGELGL